MSKEFKRTDRVAETMLRILAPMIQREITDPRLKGFITLSGAKVSKDLSHAKIYFTVLLDDPNVASEVLSSASGYLRSQLAKNMKLRIVPELHFVFDESIEYGKHLSRLIDEANPPKDDEQSE
ncbi:30S ribosome-binding factor RbfA [Legionella yabuuchiae]|uniref:30S ribosome-binding factor RbfA n=1 Tax=Legionella yabuuchiae TaxID=376727 RepID=UPI0010559BA4|nr:30S ribosome-binding factor RbfA [Legionella yabuuchiae]